MLRTSLFVLLISFVLYQLFVNKTLTKQPAELNSKYDYVIVGAGSAGAVLAARLSENAQNSVLLLEAGPEETALFFSHYPGLAAFTQLSRIDWGYQTEPETNVHTDANDQIGFWPRGKVLGGTSVLNYMIVNRGEQSDYDRWSKLDGCQGWAFDQVLPYFNKMESVNFKSAEGDRGKTGPLSVRFVPKIPVVDSIIESAKRKKYPNSGGDHNAPGNHQGYHYAQNNIDADGWRLSSAKAYLRPAMHRPNLHVVVNAHVTKVLFDGKLAVGVEYVHQDVGYKVQATKEVVLSAGAVATPQLLMLSGIGPKQQLMKHQIPVVLDSPQVGANLKDHLLNKFLVALNDSDAIDNLNQLSNPIRAIEYLVYYMFTGKGPISWSLLALMGHETSGLLAADYKSDIQHVLFAGDAMANNNLHYVMNMDTQVMAGEYAQAKGRAIALYAHVIQHPRSTGSITLRSNNPLDHPVITPNSLTDPVDAKIMIKGIRNWLSLVFTDNKEVAKYAPEMLWPECEGLQTGSDEYLNCVIRHRATTIYHPMCTAKMGATIQTSVVDRYLRVHGVEGLRIVDASIFPTTIGGNTNFPVMMVAERAADFIARGN